MEFCLVEGSGGGVSSVCLSTRAELELVEVWSWWEYVVYRVLGRVWQTLYGMTLLCVGLSLFTFI